MKSQIPPEIQNLGDDFVTLFLMLPAFPSREVFCQHAGCLHPRTLANIDSRGLGPTGRKVVGVKVCYPKLAAVLWLADQMKAPTSKPFSVKKSISDL